jgi:hypothetical protein
MMYCLSWWSSCLCSVFWSDVYFTGIILVTCVLVASACTSHIPDDDPLWPKHVMNLHESMD